MRRDTSKSWSGAAAGISATFNAPLAGVVFASEIILGSFAVESLTPIVVASVLADIIQVKIGEHGHGAAFPDIVHRYSGEWHELPSYIVLGLICGIAAALFIKFLYWFEDFGRIRLKSWWQRALLCGLCVGAVGTLYPASPFARIESAVQEPAELRSPALFGVGYATVRTALHLKFEGNGYPTDEAASIVLTSEEMKSVIWWLLGLALLKPILTSITLGGGGSGGVFAPSLFLGACLGGVVGLVVNLVAPSLSAQPGVYAIVGMGAVVAGTTHGVLSAILIVYEMTDNYQIILPIMAAAGLASLVSQVVDPESIYYKKLSRRGESIARGHEMYRLEHVMVRDVMVRNFPTVKEDDNITEIIRVARSHSHIETLPVMTAAGQLVGIIRAEDLHRVLDSDIAPHMLNATDIASPPPTSVQPSENLLEALREFGTRDIETLPVQVPDGDRKPLVGLLLREDVMRRYRKELLGK